MSVLFIIQYLHLIHEFEADQTQKKKKEKNSYIVLSEPRAEKFPTLILLHRNLFLKCSQTSLLIQASLVSLLLGPTDIPSESTNFKTQKGPSPNSSKVPRKKPQLPNHSKIFGLPFCPLKRRKKKQPPIKLPPRFFSLIYAVFLLKKIEFFSNLKYFLSQNPLFPFEYCSLPYSRSFLFSSYQRRGISSNQKHLPPHPPTVSKNPLFPLTITFSFIAIVAIT